MEIITNRKFVEEIINPERRIKFSKFRIFNTPWAKDKYGKKDDKNVALFIELLDIWNKPFYWLIKEEELIQLQLAFVEVKEYNMEYDHQGKEFLRYFI